MMATGLAFTAATFVAAPANAAGSPDLQLSGGPAPTVLYGKLVPVDLTASLPAGAPKGYNLAFRAVLPAGTSYVAGSAGNDGEPRILADAPTLGKTTLIWPNVDDLVASSSHTLSFQVDYNDTSSAGSPKYDVGDLIPIDTGAYISTDPRDETDFNAAGQATPGPDSYTGLAEQSTNTALTAIQIRKSEPHPEGEIPRGVHDHHAIYTLTITNNEVNPTNTVSVDDYLPAGLEFLGCAGATDHTSNAPTNPGSAEEYPGSASIVVTAPTLANDCVVPDLVETISGDPDGPGPLASGVYTHVRWNAVGGFSASQVKLIRYAAAIPIRENTMTWSAGVPATSGAQAANLDNNSGPETYDEQPLLNGAIVSGTYQAPAKPGKAVTDEGTLLRTAEDIAIQKSNDNNGLQQGDLTKWTINLQVSEYRFVEDIVITDVVPNGLCPLGGFNLTTGNSASDAECDPVGGKGPSQTFTSVDEQPNGTFVVVWDKTTFGALAQVSPSDTLSLSFWTRTRQNYQAGFADSTPVLSQDAVTNNISTQGLDFVRCAPADPTCTGGGAKIDHDEIDGTLDYDVSGSGKAASGPIILKTVAATYPASGDCNDLGAASYGKTLPMYGPGDFVCWKLRLDFPAGTDTKSQDVFDVLPQSIDYVPGSWQTVPGVGHNTVPVGGIDTTIPGRLRWPIGDPGNAVDRDSQVFEVTIKTIVGSPLGHASGDVEGNLQKFSYANTPGTAFTLRDRVDFALTLPELGLLKGVRQINNAGAVLGIDTDNLVVNAGDTVEYRIDLTNTGDAKADDARVWDLLPTGITCADVQLATISAGGTCNVVANRLEWTGIDVAVGATPTLTYKITVPVGVSPGQSYVNTAGVVELSYVGNNGAYQLVPDNNIVKDPAMPPANMPRVQDGSKVTTPGASLTKARTTSVTETGNSASSEATIGEQIDYTVTTVIPKNTTLYGTPTVVDNLGSRQTLVPGSLCAAGCTLGGVTLPTAGVSVAESPANTVAATFPATYANLTGADVALVLRFKATVLDVAANTRGTNLPNTATLSYRDQNNVARTAVGSVNTRIVEPKIALTKSHTPGGRVSPDQVLDFTVRVSNTADDNSTYFSPAHDVVVVDVVPAGTEPVDGGGNPIADGGTVPSQGGIWNAAARTITWNETTTPALNKVDPGTGVDLTYKVKVESAPIGGQVYTNVADATTRSLDSTVPGIRTSTSPGISTAPDYKAQASDSLSVVLPSVTKDVTPAQVTIGNTVVWHVGVTVPANVRFFDTTVVDTVPDGVNVDSYGAITCVSGCLGGDPVVSTLGPVPGASGTLTAAWFLGDLAAAPTPRVYDLVLNGHVRDTYRSGGAKVLSGATLTNRVSVKTNRSNVVGPAPVAVPASFDDTVGPATTVNTVVEPQLAIDKSANKGPIVGPGEQVTYTVTVTNTGTSPAYDIVVTDQPDTDLVNVVLAAGAGLNVDGWTLGDPDLRWAVPGPLAPGASVTFTYSGNVTGYGVVVPGSTIDNTAAISSYFGVPKLERDAAPGRIYREYTGPQDSVSLTVSPYADLEIVKTSDKVSYGGGDTVTWTLTVTNNGLSPAANVVVTDVLPSKVTFVSVTPSPACGQAAGTVTCGFGTLASGATKVVTITTVAKGDPPSTTTTGPHSHQLTIAKVEQYVTLQAGESSTIDLSCANGGAMSDGAAEILHVDQGTGSPLDVIVRQASSTALGTYRFVLSNTTTGQAQAKVFGTCLPPTTEVEKDHAHGLDVGALQTMGTGVLAPGRHTFVLPVTAGHHAIAPSFTVTSGVARLVASEPVPGGWSFTLDVATAGETTLGLRMLGDKTLVAGTTPHTHDLTFLHVVETVTLPPGESVQRVSCPVGYKGIVATYDLPPGVFLLGHEPQPINRDFRLLNTTNAPIDVVLDLECLAIETSVARDETATLTNTATAASSTFDPDLTNNSSTAEALLTYNAGTIPAGVANVAGPVKVAANGKQVRVRVTCPTTTCEGTLRLSAVVHRRGGKDKRVVIGTRGYRVSSGTTAGLAIKIKPGYRAAVRNDRLHGFRVR